GRGWGWGSFCEASVVRHRTTPLPTPPPTQVGLARLAQDKTRPGQARGAWGREQTEFAALIGASPSLAHPRDGVGGEATAGVDGGLPRLRARDPSLRPRAGVRRKLTQFGGRARHVAARSFRLSARDDRAGIAAGGRIEAAHLDELLRVRLQPRQHALARR